MHLKDDSLKKLLCNECGEHLSVFPVYLYPEGGQSCGRCPIKEGGQRNIPYETVAEVIEFPCKNELFGCEMRLTPKMMAEHEEGCSYKQWGCPEGCEWWGMLHEFKDHYFEKHLEMMQAADEFFECPLLDGTRKRVLLYFDDGVFLVDMDKFEAELRLSVRLVYGVNSFEFYKYEINLCRMIADSALISVLSEDVGDFKSGDDVIYGVVSLDGIDFDKFRFFKIKIINQLKNNLSKSHQLILNQLECISCKLFIRSRYIFQCQSGHSMCKQCKGTQNIDSIPPCCLNIENLSRSIPLETIARVINYPCKNQGCNAVNSYANYERHLKECRHQTYDCPFDTTCKFNAKFTALVDHLRQNHAGNVFTNKIKTDMFFNKSEQFVLIKNECLFVETHTIENEEEKVYLQVNCLAPDPHKDHCFQYDFSLSNVFGERVHFKTNSCVELPSNLLLYHQWLYEVNVSQQNVIQFNNNIK